jgi:hypothetical protein
MSRPQTTCPWRMELLEAALIFAASVGLCALAVAAVSSRSHASWPLVVVPLCLGGLPNVVLLVIGVRLCFDALQKREEGEEQEKVQRRAGLPLRSQQPRGSIQLPTVAIAQPQPQQSVYGGGGDQECAICLATVGGDGLATRQLPACRHAFHEHCIVQWLRVHSTCPICRCDARQQLPPEIVIS